MPHPARLPRAGYRARVPPQMRPRRTARCGGPLRFSVLSGQAEATQTVPCRSMFHYIARPYAARRTLVNVSAGFLVMAVSGARCRAPSASPPCFSWLAFWSCPRPRVDRVSGMTILARSSARLQRILSASICTLFDRRRCRLCRSRASALLAPRTPQTVSRACPPRRCFRRCLDGFTQGAQA